MNEVSIINKVKPLTRSALSSSNCSASSGNYAVQLLLPTTKEKTNECEAGVCWAKVIRPSY
jgi:hypothetical protein